MKKQVIQTGDSDVMYYLNNGWEIIAQAPNPYPQPYIYFFVAKDLPELLTKEEKLELYRKAAEFNTP